MIISKDNFEVVDTALNEENLWEKFRSTGDIKTYLEFCEKRKENRNRNAD